MAANPEQIMKAGALPKAYMKSLKKQLLNAAHCYRRLSSPWRRLPDFIIIGAQKAGTSSMFYYLAQHPELELSVEKEIHYYNYYAQSGKSIGWYKSFFPLKATSAGKKTGEASPNYLYSETAPQKLKQDVPEVKLIVLLRNPIDRAYSEYSMHVRQLKRNDLPTFEQSIANDNLSLHGSRLYLLRGLYAARIENWFKYFEREQFIFIKSEDFFVHPRPVLQRVYRFLGIAEVYPEDLRAQEAGSYAELSSDTRDYLERYFRTSNQALIELLGDEFQW